MKLNQKGIAHVGLIALAVVIVGVIGFAAYRIGTKNKESTKQTNTEARTEAKNDSSATLKKKIHSFEHTLLKMDIPENWQVNVENKEDNAYRGTIKALNGWGIHFIASHGGFGGGPGCNDDNTMPEMPPCPTYTVLAKEKLQTGDYLVSYSSDSAGTYDGMENCTIVTAADKLDKPDNKVGSSFVSSPWNCFGVIEANPGLGSDNPKNLPVAMLLDVVYPYNLDKKPASDYTNDPGYKEVIEALKTLRKN